METRLERDYSICQFATEIVEENLSEQELVRQNEHRVAATVIGMLGNCPETDDVGQKTFIRFYQALDKFRGESSIENNILYMGMTFNLFVTIRF